uniref:Carrier domain-containing protein n=1 Tax=Chromera velia CCMP2878 TaxID=1169474 RepID=A0A0G4FHV8_9ALVE|eukprot:Cvel_3347.t1-p1 / transcript=Cvel_3347.t1 / gene=Cvel_3347 / organism=Chromera_velia_CCMP2878 / gene_product=Long-chain-fatty-acid--CoA ligase, putative / transcript_product=Long-chain-fatty-acid--CoA ligase, putative / location=Cvel_scaffold133:68929-79746(+) / protein_length=3003 / sequence_SO=supercontig / SO=protein_coding / is_pseudo=false
MRTGSELLALSLQSAGVAMTFGIPGVQNLSLYRALAATGTPATLVSNEQNAAAMAIGFREATQRGSQTPESTLTCVNLIGGPGITHALGGIAAAKWHQWPLLVLTAGVRQSGPRFQLHDVDNLAILSPVCKHTLRPKSIEEIPLTVYRAAALCCQAPQGPVAVEVPSDFLSGRGKVTWPSAEEIEKLTDRTHTEAGGALQGLGGQLESPLTPTPSDSSPPPGSVPHACSQLCSVLQRVILEHTDSSGQDAHLAVFSDAEALEGPLRASFQGLPASPCSLATSSLSGFEFAVPAAIGAGLAHKSGPGSPTGLGAKVGGAGDWGVPVAVAFTDRSTLPQTVVEMGVAREKRCRVLVFVMGDWGGQDGVSRCAAAAVGARFEDLGAREGLNGAGARELLLDVLTDPKETVCVFRMRTECPPPPLSRGRSLEGGREKAGTETTKDSFQFPPSAAEFLSETLHSVGFRDVIVGPHSAKTLCPDLFRLLHQGPLSLWESSTEQGASFAANGFTRSQRRRSSQGVPNEIPVLLLSASAVPQSLSGVGEALLDSAPALLVILDCPFSPQSPSFPVFECCLPLCKWPSMEDMREASISSAGELRTVLEEAARNVRTLPAAPVAVRVMRSFWTDSRWNNPPTAYPTRVPTGLPTSSQSLRLFPQQENSNGNTTDEPESLEVAVRALAKAERLLIYAGAGALHCTELLIAVAERTGAVVCSSWSGKGTFPESHPQWLWTGIGAALPEGVRDIAAKADACLFLGIRLSEVATSHYRMCVPLCTVHVDVDPKVLGAVLKVGHQVQAEAGLFLSRLLNTLHLHHAPLSSGFNSIGGGGGSSQSLTPSAGWRSELLQARQPAEKVLETEAAGTVGTSRVPPALIAAELQRQLPRDSVFITDSGNGTPLFVECLRLDSPGRFLCPSDYSSMGFSVPAAVGAACGPDCSTAVALVGDGAFLMTGFDVAAARKYALRVMVVVLRDRELGLMSALQRATGQDPFCTSCPEYCVEGIAKLGGVHYRHAATCEEFRSGVSWARQRLSRGEPVILEVAVDYSRHSFFTKGCLSVKEGIRVREGVYQNTKSSLHHPFPPVSPTQPQLPQLTHSHTISAHRPSASPPPPPPGLHGSNAGGSAASTMDPLRVLDQAAGLIAQAQGLLRAAPPPLSRGAAEGEGDNKAPHSFDVWGILERAYKMSPSKVAVKVHTQPEEQEGLPCTYRDFFHLSSSLALFLCSEGGVVPGDRVGLLLPNIPEALFCHFAAAAVRVVVLNLNTRLAMSEYLHIIRLARPRWILAPPSRASELEEIYRRLASEGVVELQGIIWVGDAGGRRQGRTIMECEVPECAHRGVLANVRHLTFSSAVALGSSLLTTGGRTRLPLPVSNAGDAGFQLYFTSGTTGVPKGVLLSHRAVWLHALAAAAEFNIGPADVWGHFAPLYHVVDAFALFAITWVGGVHVMLPTYSVHSLLECIQRQSVTITNLGSTMMLQVASLPSSTLEGFSLDCVRMISCGGSPLPPEALRTAIKTFRKAVVFCSYGMTECCGKISFSLPSRDILQLQEDEQWPFISSSGRPFLLMDVRVMDEEGKEVPEDSSTVGDVLIKGETLFSGYWQNSEATAECFTPDGYFRTGDVAVRHQFGYITVVDRRKDMILVGGENVFSAEVERVLLTDPAVGAAAVVGSPDPLLGQRVVAFVERRSDQREGEKEDEAAVVSRLRRLCRRELAEYKVPSRILFCQMPRTGSGKIIKKQLRERLSTDYQQGRSSSGGGPAADTKGEITRVDASRNACPELYCVEWVCQPLSVQSTAADMGEEGAETSPGKCSGAESEAQSGAVKLCLLGVRGDEPCAHWIERLCEANDRELQLPVCCLEWGGTEASSSCEWNAEGQEGGGVSGGDAAEGPEDVLEIRRVVESLDAAGTFQLIVCAWPLAGGRHCLRRCFGLLSALSAENSPFQGSVVFLTSSTTTPCPSYHLTGDTAALVGMLRSLNSEWALELGRHRRARMLLIGWAPPDSPMQVDIDRRGGSLESDAAFHQRVWAEMKATVVAGMGGQILPRGRPSDSPRTAAESDEEAWVGGQEETVFLHACRNERMVQRLAPLKASSRQPEPYVLAESVKAPRANGETPGSSGDQHCQSDSCSSDLRWTAEPEAWTLVTGGLGGLGRLLLLYLVEKCGVRKVVVLSRSADGEKGQELKRELCSAGAVELRLIRGDVSKASDVSRAFDACGSSLRAVFHLAGVLDDGFMRQQSWKRFARVLQAKATGAAILDAESRVRRSALDAFVLFSSVFSLIGFPQLTHYAAANAFLDGLAARRRREGLPGLSVNWGPVAEDGMAHRLGAQWRRWYEDLGFCFVPFSSGLERLVTLLAAQQHQQQQREISGEGGHCDHHIPPPSVGIFSVDWQQVARAGAKSRTAFLLKPGTLYADLVSGAHAPPAVQENGSANGRGGGATDGSEADSLQEVIRGILCEVTSAEVLATPENLTADFTSLGLSSLSSLEFSQRISDTLKVRVEPSDFLEHNSIEKLCRFFQRGGGGYAGKDGETGGRDRQSPSAGGKFLPPSSLRVQPNLIRLRQYRHDETAWAMCQRFIDSSWRAGPGHPLTNRVLFDWQYRVRGEFYPGLPQPVPPMALLATRAIAQQPLGAGARTDPVSSPDVPLPGEQMLGFCGCTPIGFRWGEQVFGGGEVSMLFVAREVDGMGLGVRMLDETIAASRAGLVGFNLNDQSGALYALRGAVFQKEVPRFIAPLTADYAFICEGTETVNLQSLLALSGGRPSQKEEGSGSPLTAEPVCVGGTGCSEKVAERVGAMLGDFWRQRVAKHVGLSIDRSEDWWRWRYLETVGDFEYAVFGSAERGFVVCRLEEMRNAELLVKAEEPEGGSRGQMQQVPRGQLKALRLLECLPANAAAWKGEADAEFVEVLRASFRWGISQGAVVADFWCTSRRLEPALSGAGMLLQSDSHRLPNFLGDLKVKRGPLNAVLLLKGPLQSVWERMGGGGAGGGGANLPDFDWDATYFTKSTGDSDRPTVSR